MKSWWAKSNDYYWVGQSQTPVSTDRYYPLPCTQRGKKEHSIQFMGPLFAWLQLQSARTVELRGAQARQRGKSRNGSTVGYQSPSGRQAWGSGGLISRLSVNWGLSQFDRAVDNNSLGGEDDWLIRLFQHEKRAPYITPGNRKCREGRRVPQSSRLPRSGISIVIVWTVSIGVEIICLSGK